MFNFFPVNIRGRKFVFKRFDRPCVQFLWCDVFCAAKGGEQIAWFCPVLLAVIQFRQQLECLWVVGVLLPDLIKAGARLLVFTIGELKFGLCQKNGASGLGILFVGNLQPAVSSFAIALHLCCSRGSQVVE